MGRSPCCSKDSVNRSAWSAYEDSLLTEYIEAHGEGGWRSLPKKAGLKRCGKSCRFRWLNYLRPNIKRGNISADEEELIIRMHALLGNRWSLIAGRVPGRTDNEIKNYWNTCLSKKLALKGLDQKTRQTVLDSHGQNEKKAANVLAPKCIKPMNSMWPARSTSMALQILDDNDQQINCDFPEPSYLNYSPSVLDDQRNFSPSSPAQMNDEPSSYTSPPDFTCSKTLVAAPDDYLTDVEVMSSRCLNEMIISCLPEAPNLTSVDQLQFHSGSLFNSTSDFSQSSNTPETGNDVSYFSTTVPELHERTVTPNVNNNCPLQESADEINNNIRSNTSLHSMAPSDEGREINVHTDQKCKFEEVLNFLEAEAAEKEICFNRLKHYWGQNHAQQLKVGATSVSHALMDQWHGDGHKPLHIQGDPEGSYSLDYGLIDGSSWEVSLWHWK